MAYQPTDFYVQDTTPNQNPVQGVVVKVFSQDGKLVYGLETTDANGHAGFLLPDGQSYQARFYKFGVSFGGPQLFTIALGSTQNAFNVAAQLVTPPVPNDPRLCTAFGFFRDVTGAPQCGVQIHFIAKFDPVWLEGAAVVKERVVVTTDKNGYAQVNLIRNGQYNCTVQGEEDVDRLINVPDAPNVNIADLIFPVVQQAIVTPAGPWTVKVGETLSLGVDFIGSDGEDLGLAYADVLWSTSDGTVVNYAINSPSGIIVTGIGPGTANIVVKRANTSIVRIPDAGILVNGVAGGLIPITVTT